MKGSIRTVAIPVVLLWVLLAGCAQATQVSTVPPAAIPTSAATVPITQAAPASTVTAAPAQPSTAIAPAATETQVQPSPTPADATGFPPAGSLVLTQLVSGLNRPTGFVDPADGSGRFFILEQDGLIQVVRNGRLSLQPFADLTDRVGPSGGERGLLGMDVEPGFESTGIFYVNYTDDNGNTNISRFHTLPNDPEKADLSSEQVLIHQEQPYPNHNGGGVVFGPDGYLWLSLGDGGSAGDPQGNAQNVNTLLGKLLRIDVAGQESYTIPPDNPFASGGGRQEVYAWGLRNSWRFSFDRQNGDLYIADVGQNQWEEIDYYQAGSPPGPNFGWNYFEGSHPYKGQAPAGVEVIPPVWQYDHALGCSITGGFVYRGEKIPGLRGVYLYTDYCSGNLYGLVRSPAGEWLSERLIEVDGNFSAMGQDANGDIYLLDHGDGLLYRLDGATP